MATFNLLPNHRPWKCQTREQVNTSLASHYGRMSLLGASPIELQEIAWVTYLGNVYGEEIHS